MKTLYIHTPPNIIPCWYCQQPCQIHEKTYYVIREYECYRHGETVPMFRAAQHPGLPEPNWFFNVVKVTRGDWRLFWNFYSGPDAWLERLSTRQIVDTNIPASFMYSDIKMISSFLNLYRVFS